MVYVGFTTPSRVHVNVEDRHEAEAARGGERRREAARGGERRREAARGGERRRQMACCATALTLYSVTRQPYKHRQNNYNRVTISNECTH